MESMDEFALQQALFAAMQRATSGVTALTPKEAAVQVIEAYQAAKEKLATAGSAESAPVAA